MFCENVNCNYNKPKIITFVTLLFFINYKIKSIPWPIYFRSWNATDIAYIFFGRTKIGLDFWQNKWSLFIVIKNK